MSRFHWLTRRLLPGVVAAALLLGGSLIDAGEAMAAFGSSPGSPGADRACGSGTHIPEVTLVSRKAGEGQKDFV